MLPVLHRAKMASLLLFFLLFIQIATSDETCQNSCQVGPKIRFPFGFKGNRCSYPGFNVSCNNKNQTILSLPLSGNFIIELISYQTKIVHIKDPENCLPKRFMKSFSLSGSPFVPEYLYRTYTFLNCSSSTNSSSSLYGSRPVPCLSNDNYTVVAVPTSIYMDTVPPMPLCKVIVKSVWVPVPWPSWSDGDTRLLWSEPDCVQCEERGGTCGFKGDTGLDVGCYNLPKTGLPRSAKYGLIIGVGIPGVLCIIGAACYLCNRVSSYSQRLLRPQSNGEFSTSIAPHPTILIMGLDGQTIESYPKTILGESGRLPKPGDNTCPICLSEYQAKETLRTIPDCNHYFHAECIDEWLKVNGTCPLCRNSPETSSLVTPSSSMSLSSTSLSTS